jgi:hypothetical protein
MNKRWAIGLSVFLVVGIALAEEKKPEDKAILGQCWKDLASRDTVVASRALVRLASMPEASKFLAEKLVVVKIDKKNIASLIEKLGDDDFETRANASVELEYFGKTIKGILEKAFEESKEIEVKARLKALLDKMPPDEKTLAAAGGAIKGRSISTRIVNGDISILIDGKPLDLSARVMPMPPLNGQWLRVARAVGLLENLNTEQAKAILRKLAAGEAEAGPTIDAKAALKRLGEKE